jgi:SAM-dependent methyltransferase
MVRSVNVKYRFKKILKMLVTGRKAVDDYDWQFYTGIYRDGLKDVAKDHSLALAPGDYEFQGGKLLQKNHGLPLHPNYSIIYETLLQLQPNSVMEIGCGCGDHLHNIQVLASAIKLFGVDISQGQLKFLQQRHPDLNAVIRQYSITTPPRLCDLPQVDVAFTQAVIMHIRKDHQDALVNLFHIARHQVVLMENWKRHEFMPDIQRLFDEKKLPWKSIYFYYRDSYASEKPHLMIVSSQPLPQYQPLADYSTLRNTVEGI